ncbi:MAG: DnaA N-terminal domain-containing protein, partial [Succiniclasticum sp.]
METNDLSVIWDRLTEKLSHATSESNMDMYIRQITPVKLENDVITCTVPSTNLCSAIQQNHISLILAALSEITGNKNINIDLKVENQNDLNIARENYKVKPLFTEEDKAKDGVYESNINKKQRFDNF